MISNFKERKMWIRKIWSHHRAAKNPDNRLWPTYFWPCVRATIALLFDRFEEERDTWNEDWEDVAWGEFEYYPCDFGTQESWTTCAVSGLSYTFYTDSKY